MSIHISTARAARSVHVPCSNRPSGVGTEARLKDVSKGRTRPCMRPTTLLDMMQRRFDFDAFLLRIKGANRGRRTCR
jgi:hypothetical protein